MIIKQEVIAPDARQDVRESIITVAGVKMKLTVRDAWDGGSTADEPGVYLRQTWLEPVQPIKYWLRENQP